MSSLLIVGFYYLFLFVEKNNTPMFIGIGLGMVIMLILIFVA